MDTSGNTMDEEIADGGLREAINEANHRAIVALVGSIDLDYYCVGLRVVGK